MLKYPRRREASLTAAAAGPGGVLLAEANLEVVVVTTLVTCLPTSNHRLPTRAHVGVGVPMLFRLDSATDPVHPFPVVLSFFFSRRIEDLFRDSLSTRDVNFISSIPRRIVLQTWVDL